MLLSLFDLTGEERKKPSWEALLKIMQEEIALDVRKAESKGKGGPTSALSLALA